MRVLTTTLRGVLLIEPEVHGDSRGYFLETWHHQRYAAAGLDVTFVQDNLSFSQRNTLRGLHYQHPHGQGKLVYVLAGEVLDVAVDIRNGSPTFGRWFSAALSSQNHRQLYLPPGFAHGFCVTSESALVAYKCTEFYDPQAEKSICWNDPDLAIAWPVTEPILSAKDQAAPLLRHLPAERLPS
jgi:dTDP-4-dehydrorhamnose 3,5-epimerase